MNSSPLISSSAESENDTITEKEFDNNLFDNEIETIPEISTANKSDIFGESLSDLSAEESIDEIENENEDQDEFQHENEQTSTIDQNWVAKLKIPRIRIDQGNEMHFIKLPVFLNIESRPFDSVLFNHDETNDEEVDELETKRLRLKIENTVRWRSVNTDNGPTKQSNARFIQWSDGSLSFYVGNKVFDVYKTNIAGDHNHLFIRHGSYLHGQAHFRTKLTFRPHTTESNASARVSMPLGRKLISSQQKIRILSSAGQNPDINRIELMKGEKYCYLCFSPDRVATVMSKWLKLHEVTVISDQEGKRLRREDRHRNLLEKRKEDARIARRQMTERFLERNEDEDSDTAAYSETKSDKMSDDKISNAEEPTVSNNDSNVSDFDEDVLPLNKTAPRIYSSSEDESE